MMPIALKVPGGMVGLPELVGFGPFPEPLKLNFPPFRVSNPFARFLAESLIWLLLSEFPKLSGTFYSYCYVYDHHHIESNAKKQE